eukprot:2051101-Pyramimonas_sp.AAC.1
MGAVPPTPDAAPADKVLFRLDRDDTFFKELDQLDCEGGEKDKLKELERQLREAQQLAEGKHSEVKDWQARMAQLKE